MVRLAQARGGGGGGRIYRLRGELDIGCAGGGLVAAVGDARMEAGAFRLAYTWAR